jgi:UDP-3-O-[3-hydroxymyristoyl] glucosamine N-acyltransferase
MTLTLAELAELIGGRLVGRGDVVVEGAASPHAAGPRDVTFVMTPADLPKLLSSSAGGAVVPEGVDVPGRDVVQHKRPYVALSKTLETLYPPERVAPGVHPTACVDAAATLGARVHVGPHAVVHGGAVLGDGVRIGAGAYVGRDVKIGANSTVFAHAALYERVVVGARCIVHAGAVIGADGFGFTPHDGGHLKIPQVGGVLIGDDVEIGANTCIDSGTMEPTRIGSGTKIDNLVQIGHNCVIGRRVIICGSVGLAGSVTVEDGVTLAGQVGVNGHVTVGAGTVATAQAGIISDVPPKSVVAGFPQMPMEDWRRSSAAVRRLPDLLHEVRDMRRRLEQLERGR